jgi:hypothetical protein
VPAEGDALNDVPLGGDGEHGDDQGRSHDEVVLSGKQLLENTDSPWETTSMPVVLTAISGNRKLFQFCRC